MLADVTVIIKAFVYWHFWPLEGILVSQCIPVPKMEKTVAKV